MADASAQTAAEGDHWAVDKRIPIALIFTLLAQTVAIAWWAATTQARVDALEGANASLGLRTGQVEKSSEELQVVRYRLDNVEKVAQRIETKVDQIQDTQRGKGSK